MTNAENNGGDAPLRGAAWQGRADAVRALAELGVDVDFQSAAWLRRLDTVRALADVDAKSNGGDAPL